MPANPEWFARLLTDVRTGERVPEPEELREQSLSALKRTPLFRKMSRRLLLDLVDRTEVRRAREITDPSSLPIIVFDFAVLVVLEGTIVVRQRLGAPEPLPSPLPPGLPTLAVLQPGVYLRNDSRFADINQPQIETLPGELAYFLAIEIGDLHAVPTAVRFSLDLFSMPEGDRETFAVTGLPPVELVWMAADNGIDDDLEMLTHLLAAVTVRDHGEPAVIVVLGGNPEVVGWVGGTFTAYGGVLPAVIGAGDLAALAMALPGPAAALRRVFVVHPPHTLARPARLDDTVRFDRIVLLTDTIPDDISGDLQELLRPSASSGGGAHPYFSSVIPSILVPEPRSFSILSSVWEMLTPGSDAPHFRPRQLADTPLHAAGLATPASMGDRLHRDACNLRLDLALLDDLWNAWQGSASPFLDELVPVEPDPVLEAHYETVRRWGRAITNRRVGIAVSGGGASAYRLGALLDELDARAVPVDVVAGVSGGALVGAYYCSGGREGFERALDLGLGFFLLLPFLPLSSWPVELLIDWDRGGRRVEDLERRYVAVATSLPKAEPPQATAIDTGRLGEAVRASGALPQMFAPVEKNAARFADGATAAVIPVRAVRDHGADVALSLNAIPGPQRSNPFDRWLLGRLLHDWTPIGRAIDLWTAGAFFIRRASREFSVEADAFVEFDLQAITLLETLEFVNADAIVARAAADPKVAAGADRLATVWRKLGKRGP